MHLEPRSLVGLPGDLHVANSEEARLDGRGQRGAFEVLLEAISGEPGIGHGLGVPWDPRLGGAMETVPVTVALPESPTLDAEGERPRPTRADQDGVTGPRAADRNRTQVVVAVVEPRCEGGAEAIGDGQSGDGEASRAGGEWMNDHEAVPLGSGVDK